MALQTLIHRFRDSRDQRKARKHAAREQEKALQAAIEHVVDVINPRLRGIPAYRKKLAPCVSRTLAYADSLAEHVPGPVDIDSRSWNSEPLARPLFSSADDVREFFSLNREVRKFFSDTPLADSCYAMLSATLTERTVLGMEMQGETVRKDVKKTAVSFSDRQIPRVAASEEELRTELKQRALEVLVLYALQHITRLTASLDSLKQEQQLLAMKEKMDQVRENSLEPLMDSDHAGEPVSGRTRQHRRRTSDRLDRISRQLGTLEDYIDRIADILGEPDTHLTFKTVSMRLDRMNIKLGPNAAGGEETTYNEFYLGDEVRRIVLITHFPRSELQDLPEPVF